MTETLKYGNLTVAKELDEFLRTGKSDCLPKHPSILTFPDIKVRKSKKTPFTKKNVLRKL